MDNINKIDANLMLMLSVICCCVGDDQYFNRLIFAYINFYICRVASRIDPSSKKHNTKN